MISIEQYGSVATAIIVVIVGAVNKYDDWRDRRERVQIKKKLDESTIETSKKLEEIHQMVDGAMSRVLLVSLDRAKTIWSLQQSEANWKEVEHAQQAYNTQLEKLRTMEASQKLEQERHDEKK